MLAGTRVRVPYLNGNFRIDGFAGTRFREDIATSPTDYRSAWRHNAIVQHDALRAERIAMQNGLQMEALTYALALAQPGFVVAAPWLFAGWAGAAYAAGMSGCLAVITAASSRTTPYGIRDAASDFAVGAGYGLLSYGACSYTASLGLGSTGVAAASLVNNWGISTAQLMMQGMDFGDAITTDAMARISYTALDIGPAMIPSARTALMKFSGKVSEVSTHQPMGGGRPQYAAQTSPHEIWVEPGRESATEALFPDAEVKVKTQAMAASEATMMSALQEDAVPGRLAAIALREGHTRIAYYRGERDTASWYGYRWGRDPDTIYINLDQMRRDSTGRMYGVNKYQLAAVVVHETMHAYRGSEFHAFLAQGVFTDSIARRSNLGPSDVIKWFGEDGQYVQNLYRESENLGNYEFFRDRSIDHFRNRYEQREFRIPAGDPAHSSLKYAVGWNRLLGIYHPMFEAHQSGGQMAPYSPPPP